MGVNPDDLNLINEQAVQKVIQTNRTTTNYYQNVNKHKKCSKCSTLITTEKYKKDRSVCKNCCNANTLNLMKNRFGLLEESKEDISNKQIRSRKQASKNNHDNSNEQDSIIKQFRSTKQNRSNKQVRSRKGDSSNKQDCSDKQDISSNYLIDVDPDLLCDKLREILSKCDMIETGYTMVKLILDELLKLNLYQRNSIMRCVNK